MAIDRKIIVDIVEAYYRETLLEDEVWRVKQEYDPTPPEFEKDILALEILQSDLRDQLRLNDYSFVEEPVQSHLKRRREFNVDPEKLEYQIICRECLKATIKSINVILRRMRGDYDAEPLCEWIPDDLRELTVITELQEPPMLAAARTAGRPSSEWDAIAEELNRIVDDDPSNLENSRIHLSERLAAWYAQEFKKSIQPKTIRDRLKDVFRDLGFKN